MLGGDQVLKKAILPFTNISIFDLLIVTCIDGLTILHPPHKVPKLEIEETGNS